MYCLGFALTYFGQEKQTKEIKNERKHEVRQNLDICCLWMMSSWEVHGTVLCVFMYGQYFSQEFWFVCILKNLFIYLNPFGCATGLQDLSSPSRDWTWALIVKPPSPNHPIAREFPQILFWMWLFMDNVTPPSLSRLTRGLLGGKSGGWAARLPSPQIIGIHEI